VFFFNNVNEQFIIFPIATIYEFLYITNIVSFLILLIILITYGFLSVTKKTTNNISMGAYSIGDILLDGIFFEGAGTIAHLNFKSKNSGSFVPLIASILLFIFAANVLGNTVFCYAINSQIFTTSLLSFSLFIGIQIIGLRLNSIKFFSLYFPQGISVVLSLLLVPIELISFLSKPFSLAIRLFANIMAGHTLLKVIAGFMWAFSSQYYQIFAISEILVFFVLFFLIGLEVAVGVIQAYVFAVLFTISLNDSCNLH